MSIPRTTHQWLQPLYNVLDGHASRPLQLSSPTGIVGFFGASGIKQPTGLGVTGSAAAGGVTGTTFFDLRTNGGTGTNYYTLTDVVADLKGLGILAR
jgi:hypothetical protein